MEIIRDEIINFDEKEFPFNFWTHINLTVLTMFLLLLLFFKSSIYPKYLCFLGWFFSNKLIDEKHNKPPANEQVCVKRMRCGVANRWMWKHVARNIITKCCFQWRGGEVTGIGVQGSNPINALYIEGSSSRETILAHDTGLLVVC